MRCFNPETETQIKRIARDKCKLSSEQIASLVDRLDRDAELYRIQVRRFGEHVDSWTVRDELKTLRKALKVSESTKDFLTYALHERGANDSDAAILANLGKSFVEGPYLLGALDSIANRAEGMLEVNAKGGRPVALQRRLLVQSMARSFERSTGTAPTATPEGAFFQIVCAVFDAVKLKRTNPRKIIEAALKGMD